MKSAFNVLLALCFCLSVIGAERKQPDIIVIMADDAGFSDFGCYGGEIETPALDKLAANGLRFSQFYNTGRCCPSRAALLTGVYQHQAGMGHMTKDRGIPSYSGTILPHVPTLAERLRKGGYRTMMTGKWHLGTEPQQSPTARGFDRFYGTRNFIDSYFTVLKHCPVFLDNKEVLPAPRHRSTICIPMRNGIPPMSLPITRCISWMNPSSNMPTSRFSCIWPTMHLISRYMPGKRTRKISRTISGCGLG